MAAPCETRIRYSSLLVHLIGGNLAGGIEEGEDSSSRRFHVVDLVQSTRVRGLVLEDLDQFKGSMVAALALGCWSLGARARMLPDCHQHRQADFGKGATRQRLVPATVVVVRWSKYLNVLSIMFGMLCPSRELMK
jgi:hypothetical protein